MEKCLQHSHCFGQPGEEVRISTILSWREAALFFLWCFFVFLIYANTLNSPFILDDSRIYNNSHIRLTTLSPASLARAAFESEPATRPVSNLSFALNYYFHQYKVWGYHVVNILIHVTTGFLLYFLVKATLCLALPEDSSSSPALMALFSVFLWLVHPLQTQSITYVVQRMNSLAAMFYILSMLCYVLGRLSKRTRRMFLFAASLVAAFLALGSKEIAATLPAFVFLYEWFFFQDLQWDWLKKRLVVLAGILIFLSGAVLIYTDGHPVQAILSSYATRDFTLGQRLLTETRVVCLYIGLLLLPYPGRLNLDHDFQLSTAWLSPPATLAALLLLACLFVGACLAAKRERLVSFCVLWFLGQLVIESSFIGLEIIFEHRLYLPSMFAAVLFVFLLYRFIRVPMARTVVLCIMILVASLWTYERNMVWRDEITLWTDSVSKSPQKARPHNNLGVHLKRSGRLDEALYHFKEVVRLDPEFVEAYNNIGNIFAIRGRLDEALPQYYRALQLAPNNPVLHNNIGNALTEKWELKQALLHYSEAVRLQPDFMEARVNLENLLRMIKAQEMRKRKP